MWDFWMVILSFQVEVKTSEPIKYQPLMMAQSGILSMKRKFRHILANWLAWAWLTVVYIFSKRTQLKSGITMALRIFRFDVTTICFLILVAWLLLASCLTLVIFSG